LSGCHKSVFTHFTLTRTFLFTEKLISCELQNISGNTVIKIKSVIILLLLLLLLQSPHGGRASTAISQMRPSTGFDYVFGKLAGGSQTRPLAPPTLMDFWEKLEN
jgi:hypothetical protein